MGKMPAQFLLSCHILSPSFRRVCMKYLKQRVVGILLAFLASAQALALESAPPVLAPLQQQAQAAKLTAQILSRYHYKPMPLDNALSEKIFDRYLKALDPEKVFFTQADIDRFAS